MSIHLLVIYLSKSQHIICLFYSPLHSVMFLLFCLRAHLAVVRTYCKLELRHHSRDAQRAQVTAGRASDLPAHRGF